jgi:hypothetical protein
MKEGDAFSCIAFLHACPQSCKCPREGQATFAFGICVNLNVSNSCPAKYQNFHQSLVGETLTFLALYVRQSAADSPDMECDAAS